jgi:hypothetical protein
MRAALDAAQGFGGEGLVKSFAGGPIRAAISIFSIPGGDREVAGVDRKASFACDHRLL